VARRKNKGRAINGVLLLDKPIGFTSNAVLQKAKRLFNANKAGHTGSLDPIASGLLPICFGEATKFSTFLLDSDKRYIVVCRLGEVTNTGDSEGEVIRTMDVPELSQSLIHAVLKSFLGEQTQIPPMHSALKVNGQPLYKLAHQGKEIERQPRDICIHELKLLSFSQQTLELEVHCSKGTYIRTLVEDIAKALNTGAHVISLRRISVGNFDLKNSVTLEKLEETLAESGITGVDEKLLPMETAISQWPELNLSQDAAFYLCQGQPVLVPKAPTEGWVRLYQAEGEFIGIGCIQDDGRVAPKRMVKVA